METEKLKSFQGLYITIKTDACFIKGKLTHVDDDSLIINQADVIKLPSFLDTYSDNIMAFSWIVVNRRKVWDCFPSYEQLSNNYTISSAGVSLL